MLDGRERVKRTNKSGQQMNDGVGRMTRGGPTAGGAQWDGTERKVN